MNKETILAMEPGRELDALVAEKVMGQNGYDFDDTHWYCSTCKAWVHPAQVTFHEVHERCQTPVVSDWCDENGNVMPFYSTDIAAAWEVVEKWPIMIITFVEIYQGNKRYKAEVPTDTGSIEYECTSAPEAICKAALLATLEANNET